MIRIETFRAKGADRLDLFLASSTLGISRSQAQRWIRDGRVRVEGTVAARPGQRLTGSERVDVELREPEPASLEAEAIPFDILYEDESILVLDKPAGLVVHPSPGHARSTLVNAILAHAPDLRGVGGERRPGIVHRLDRETSGVMVVAKDDASYHAVQAQFEDRSVEKMYRALVSGLPPAPEGEIAGALGRDQRDRKKMSVVSPRKGRAATTRYRVLETYPGHAELLVVPATGRTHQIRVHLATIGAPVLGDRVYGRRNAADEAPRTMLHAWKLGIRLPSTGERIVFEAALPADYLAAREDLRREVARVLRSKTQPGASRA